MTSPSSGSTVSGTVRVSASALDNVGITGVQFKLDGRNLGAEERNAPYEIWWDTTTASNGSHSLTAVARDAAGNTRTASAIPVTISNGIAADTLLPTVTMTSPGSGSTVSGTVRVSASALDNVGIAGVQFKLDGQNLGAEEHVLPYEIWWDTTKASNGSHTLTAVARDPAGNTRTASAIPVTVSNGIAGSATSTTPLTVAMTSPTPGTTVSGSVRVAATALSGAGIAGVQFKLDGQNLGAEEHVLPYEIWWDTTRASNGSHTLTAVARDGAGNTSTAVAIPVTVSNGTGTSTLPLADMILPTVTMTSPSNGSTVSGTVRLSASALDNVGIAGLQFKLDGQNLGAEERLLPYEIFCDTTKISNGPHTLTAVARDAAGNNSTATAVTVIVSNLPVGDTILPTATMTSPSYGSTVSGTVQVSASALDNVGITGVQFKLDGQNLGTEEHFVPYEITWDTTAVVDGSHVLSAVARDSAGNTGVALAINVIVSNNPDNPNPDGETTPPEETTPPAVEIIAPSSGDAVLGTVRVIATASDNVGVAGVQFSLDGVNLGDEVKLAPYEITWDTTNASGGSHTLTAIARDTSGNRTVSAPITVTVSNTTPFTGTPIPVPGTFEAEDFDRGGEGLAYHDNTPGNQGGQYRLDEDVDIIVSADSAGGGFSVSGFETGEWLAYTIDVQASALYDLELRVSSTFSDSALRVEIDGRDATGAITVPNTGSSSEFQWVGRTGVPISAGRHVLKVFAVQQFFDLNSIRLTRSAQQEPPPPPVGAQFFCTFPTSPTDCGFTEEAKVPGRATIVGNGRDGATAVRLHTEPGDDNVAGSNSAERNALRLSQSETDGFAGQEQWWAHSVLFPDDFVRPSQGFYTVFEFHHTNTAAGGQPNIQLAVSPDAVSLFALGGPNIIRDGNDALTIERLGPLVRNVWYDFVYRVRWSSGSDGIFDAWLNGRKVAAHRGPTLYSGEGVFLKLQNYHTAFGVPSSVIHDRVVRGTTPEAVAPGPLEGVP